MAAEPTLDDADDQTLLAAHVDGDPAAFGVLFARHRDRLFAYVYSLLPRREDAEDPEPGGDEGARARGDVGADLGDGTPDRTTAAGA
jgi:hypothetical protein